MMLYRILNQGDKSGGRLDLPKSKSEIRVKRTYLCLFTCVYKMKNKEQMISLF